MKKRARPGGTVLPNVKKKKGARVGKRKRIWGRGTNSQNRIDGGLTLFSPTLASGLDKEDALKAMYERRDLVRERMKQIVIQKKSQKVSSFCFLIFFSFRSTRKRRNQHIKYRSKNPLEHLNNFIENFFLRK